VIDRGCNMTGTIPLQLCILHETGISWKVPVAGSLQRTETLTNPLAHRGMTDIQSRFQI
jgi:hypothetical protein